MADTSCRYTSATPLIFRFWLGDIRVLTGPDGPLHEDDERLWSIMHSLRHPQPPLHGNKPIASLSYDDAVVLSARLSEWIPGAMTRIATEPGLQNTLTYLSQSHRALHRHFRLPGPIPPLATSHKPQSPNPVVAGAYRRRREQRVLRRILGARRASSMARDLAERYNVAMVKPLLARAFGLRRDLHDEAAEVPYWAWTAPYLPRSSLPNVTTDLDVAADALCACLRAADGLAQCETLAMRCDGPARWARSWTVELLTDCILGPRRSVTSVDRAEVRSVVERCWATVVAESLDG